MQLLVAGSAGSILVSILRVLLAATQGAADRLIHNKASSQSADERQRRGQRLTEPHFEIRIGRAGKSESGKSETGTF